MSDAVHLRGRKVVLDTFTPADLTDSYIAWLNDPQVVRYSNQRFRSHDRESCGAYLQSFAGTPNLFLSVKTLSGEAIGTMTAYRAIAHGTVDIGIMIGQRNGWGTGYGQDAWDLLLGWSLSRTDIRKATAGTLACNKGMVRLMERSGMILEGVRRAQEIVDGVPQDLVLYGKFAP